jgi:hypothetical protein
MRTILVWSDCVEGGGFTPDSTTTTAPLDPSNGMPEPHPYPSILLFRPLILTPSSFFSTDFPPL